MPWEKAKRIAEARRQQRGSAGGQVGLGEPPPDPGLLEDTGPTRFPIGVPEGFVTQTGTPHGQLRDLPPRYFEGDEGQPAMLRPEEIWDIQQNLVRVGLLADGNFQRGVWDASTQSAYKWLLGMANRNGITDEAMMSRLLSAPEEFLYSEEEEEGFERPPLVVRQTDPEQLQQVFRRAIIDLTGEGWSQEEIGRLAAAYNEMEKSRQQEYYDLSDPEGEGGTMFDMMSPEAFIQSRVEEEDPLAIPSHEMLQFAQDAINMAGSPSWGSGLPSTGLQGSQL